MKLRLPKISLTHSGILLEYIAAFLLIVFCNFWVYKGRPLIPLYYFYLMSLLCIPFLIFIKMKGTLSKGQILSIICSLWIFGTFLYQNTEDWQYIAHPGTAVSCYVITIFFINYLSKKRVLSVTNIMLVLNTLYISAETFWRISHPASSRAIGAVIDNSADSSSAIYLFKCNSFMYSDSNSVGLALLVLLFLTLYLYLHVQRRKLYLGLIFIYSILIVLTFSRAALIALILSSFIIWSYYFLKKQIVLYKNTKKTTLKFLLYIIFVPVIFSIFGILIIFYLLHDGSFATKIDLFAAMGKYFKIASLKSILFGIGTNLNLSNKYFGRYPHTIILTYLAWYGIVGMCLIYYWWCVIIKETRYKALYIFLPQIFAGISYTMPGLHIFYVALGIVYYFEKRAREKIELYQHGNISNYKGEPL